MTYGLRGGADLQRVPRTVSWVTQSTASTIACGFFWPLSLAAELSHRTEPVLEVVGSGNLAVSDGLNVDCHDSEGLGAMGHTEEIRSGCSRHPAVCDRAVPRDENFLDLEISWP